MSPLNFPRFQDVLSLTEFELMELLDVGLSEVASAVAHISEITCPPYQTVSFLTPVLSSLIPYMCEKMMYILYT